MLLVYSLFYGIPVGRLPRWAEPQADTKGILKKLPKNVILVFNLYSKEFSTTEFSNSLRSLAHSATNIIFNYIGHRSYVTLLRYGSAISMFIMTYIAINVTFCQN